MTKLRKNDDAKKFVLLSYQNGMRVKELQNILVHQYDVKISDRTLYRFIVKNCPDNRYRITHPNGKNKVEEND